MRIIRIILRAVFCSPRLPQDQLRAGVDQRPVQPQFITLVNGGLPVR